MAEFQCTSAMNDAIYAADNFDGSGELELGIYMDSDEPYAHVFLSKTDAKKLAEHILHLLEESK